MKIVHRVPWTAPYGYSEIEFTDDPNESPIDYTAIMVDVKAAEDAYRAEYNVPAHGESPLVDNAMRAGATPSARPVQQQPYVDHTQQYVCKQCGGSAEVSNRAVKTKRGMSYPVNCTSGCKNDRGYAFTTAWQDA
jgi:hypothetical protein